MKHIWNRIKSRCKPCYENRVFWGKVLFYTGISPLVLGLIAMLLIIAYKIITLAPMIALVLTLVICAFVGGKLMGIGE